MFELGLLQDDREWETVLHDAAHTQMCQQMRLLFTTLLLFCYVANPRQLFERYHHQWWDDYKYSAAQNASGDVSDGILRVLVLCDLEHHISSHGKNLSHFGLPQITECEREQANTTLGRIAGRCSHLSLEIQNELDFDREMLKNYHDARITGPNALTTEQRHIYEEVLSSIRNNRPGTFFIDAPGGTGKSYVLNTILAGVRLLDENSIAIAVAASGIAANLLLLGRTFHSRFKAPLDVTETTTLNITKQSHLAELLRRSKLIVWDEAPMNNRFLLEALDRTLRDLTNHDFPFGGKNILLAGDFRQILPVIKHGSRPQIVESVMKKSFLWQKFQCFRLTGNMRVIRSGSQHLTNFAEWLLLMGEGKLPTIDKEKTYIELPIENCFTIRSEDKRNLEDSMKKLIDFTYPQIEQQFVNRGWLSERAPLATMNVTVDELNKQCLQLIPGDIIHCHSADVTVDINDSTRFPTEYLNTLSVNGIPPHHLIMKIGCPLMLLRNIDPRNGLCNGTRLILESIDGQMLKCSIAGGRKDGYQVLIPRLSFTPNDSEGFPMQWRRRQFPVRTAFAMTINKSQGQSLSKVGVWLEDSVFTHGQLYVASSRVGNPPNIKYSIKKHQNFPENATKNIVFQEVFE